MGPAGGNGISGLQFVDAVTTPFNAGRGFNLPPIEISCPAGKVPVTGGYELMNSSAQTLQVITSRAVNDAMLVGWRLEVKNVYTSGTVGSCQVRIYVGCAFAQ